MNGNGPGQLQGQLLPAEEMAPCSLYRPAVSTDDLGDSTQEPDLGQPWGRCGEGSPFIPASGLQGEACPHLPTLAFSSICYPWGPAANPSSRTASPPLTSPLGLEPDYHPSGTIHQAPRHCQVLHQHHLRGKENWMHREPRIPTPGLSSRRCCGGSLRLGAVTEGR